MFISALRFKSALVIVLLVRLAIKGLVGEGALFSSLLVEINEVESTRFCLFLLELSFVMVDGLLEVMFLALDIWVLELSRLCLGVNSGVVLVTDRRRLERGLLCFAL